MNLVIFLIVQIIIFAIIINYEIIPRYIIFTICSIKNIVILENQMLFIYY